MRRGRQAWTENNLFLHIYYLLDLFLPLGRTDIFNSIHSSSPSLFLLPLENGDNDSGGAEIHEMKANKMVVRVLNKGFFIFFLST